MHRIVKILAAIFGVLGVVFLFLILAKGDQTIKDQYFADGSTSTIDPMYIIGVIMLVVTTLIVLVFALKGLATGDIKKTLITLGLFVGVVLISYLLADGGTVTANGQTYGPSVTKWVGAGLYAFYILGFVAVASMLWSGLTKLKK